MLNPFEAEHLTTGPTRLPKKVLQPADSEQPVWLSSEL
jgi:hypothetical protein